MAFKKARRRTRYVRLGARRSRTHSVGIGTTVGAVAAIAPILGAGTPYDMISEIKSAMSGGQGPSQVLYKMIENVKAGWPMMAAGIAIPMIAKKFLPNPTIARFGRTTIKGL